MDVDEKIGRYSIVSEILKLMIKDTTTGFTWISLFLIAIMVKICMCCRSQFSTKKDKVEESDIEVEESDSTRKGKSSSEKKLA